MAGGRQPTVLVLAGGNALGAYQAGAYEALAARGLVPDWFVGASIGAVQAAILAGNPPEARLDRLRDYWRLAASPIPPGPVPGIGVARRLHNDAAALHTLLVGRPGLFRPRLLGLWAAWPAAEAPSHFDTAPLAATLRDLVDFDRLNGGGVRLTVTAVDVETGEDVVFDTRRDRIGPEHLLASSGFPGAFPPIEIDGRLLGDPGVSANLPLDPVLAEAEGDGLCLAVDLFAPQGPRPATLGNAIERGRDLLFACQSRRRIAALVETARLRRALAEAAGGTPAAGAFTLVHLAYAAWTREVSSAVFDYSPTTLGDRWTAGREDMAAALDLLAAGGSASARPPVAVHRIVSAAAPPPAPPARRPDRR